MPKTQDAAKGGAPSSNSTSELTASLEALRAEVDQMHRRLASLEERLTGSQTAKASPAAGEPIPEATIAAISAAIAAFLGHKPRLRQIRLIGNTSWALQGRATIQASHALNRIAGRPDTKTSKD